MQGEGGTYPKGKRVIWQGVTRDKKPFFSRNPS